MLYIFIWVALSFLIGSLGKNRSLGFWKAFLLSIFLSPLVGLTVVLLSDEANYGAMIAIGEQHLKRGDYDKALRIFLTVEKEKPSSATVHYQLACTYSCLQEPDRALAHLSKALENGYSNLQNLQNDTTLTNLRNYEGYKTFEKTNYAFTCFKIGQHLA